jgi:hypothetical protein
MPEIARLRESRVSTFKRFEQCRAELKYRKAFADSDGTSGYRRVPRQLPGGAFGPTLSWSVR